MDKIILTTGGTGGHIFPALAVAERVREKNPEARILFIGSDYGLEGDLSRRSGLEFYGLATRGVLGRGLKAIPATARLVMALFKARGRIKKFDPDIVAGFGGYASFAPALAAKTLGIPLLIHEQNAVCGAGNRILGGFADKICVSQKNTAGFSRDTVFTGNPVRKEIAAARREGGGKRLLILGGSQGATGINKFIAGILSTLRAAGVEVWHQCGERDFPWLKGIYDKTGVPSWRLEPFIINMNEAYGWADLAFCRSGATTVAELRVAGIPAILTPFPAAIHDHQTLNAKNMSEDGGAILIPEKELDANTGNIIIALLNNPLELEKMSRAALAGGVPDAADRIVREMEKTVLRK
ncbi:MAG: undecaprenyldiphospho-muramoylpentapeptide beta-N-acetylglucosaminyltransferase [Desulfovibrio sp.]|nr:undecaprenyldiphospho-muramoylpentapeptide beta-N-acetylglucosaminyltransferase [Desulfovibrio sp.]